MLALFRNVKSAVAVGALATGALIGTSANAADDINVRFSWKMKGEYAHMYLTQAKGYFDEADLNVRMGEGAGSQAALGALLQGQEDVIIMPGTFALAAINQGMPIRVIGLYHPRVPAVLISHPENPIVKPADLEGKRVAHAVGETGTSFLGVVCEASNIDCDKINLVTMASNARVASFLQGQVDAVSVYTTNDLPIIERDVGKSFPVFNLGDHGLAVPGLAAVSSEAIIAAKGDALGRFLAAVDKGIRDTKADPEATAKALLAEWSGAPSLDAVVAQVEATVKAMPEHAGHPFGWISEEDMSAAVQILATDETFGAPRPVDQYYTNRLLGGGS